MTNQELKDRLLHHAREVARLGGSIFQTRAYRAAALIVQGLPTPVEELLATQGRRGLERIPGIGRSIASAIAVILSMERLQSGQACAESSDRRVA
jgi:DNA polymerase (family 10)